MIRKDKSPTQPLSQRYNVYYKFESWLFMSLYHWHDLMTFRMTGAGRMINLAKAVAERHSLLHLNYYFITILCMLSHRVCSGDQFLSPILWMSVAHRFHIEGILPKGPYLPCESMAGRALLRGYHRYAILWMSVTRRFQDHFQRIFFSTRYQPWTHKPFVVPVKCDDELGWKWVKY